VTTAPTLVPMHRLINVAVASPSVLPCDEASAASPTVPGTRSRKAGWNDTVAGTANVSLSMSWAAINSMPAVTPVATMLPVIGVSVASNA